MTHKPGNIPIKMAISKGIYLHLNDDEFSAVNNMGISYIIVLLDRPYNMVLLTGDASGVIRLWKLIDLTVYSEEKVNIMDNSVFY